MAKTIAYDEEARRGLERGLNSLADAVKVTLFGFAAGEELTEHTAAYPAILHFISGEADLQLGEEQTTAVPGTWVSMPARLPHSVYARTAVTMLLYLVVG